MRKSIKKLLDIKINENLRKIVFKKLFQRDQLWFKYTDLPETLKNQLTVNFNSNLKINKTNEDKKEMELRTRKQRTDFFKRNKDEVRLGLTVDQAKARR